MRQHSFDESSFDFCSFITGTNLFLQALAALLQGGDISQNELGVDYIDVADWIDRSAYMVDIIVDKASDHLNNCIHLADVAEKLVAEALALARTANQSRNINKLDRGRNDLLRLRKGG